MDDPLAHLLEPGLDLSRHQRYALERELGHGSMGVVYAARDRVLDRQVAVKVMAASIVQEAELRKYFEREARAVGRLSHRNVVVVHDFGYDPRGAPFVVMERLRGFDLRQALSGGQVPPLDRRLAVVLQVLAGLAHAHAAGVVHRDVKPANVFLTEEGVVKLLDFGIARLARAGSGGHGSSGVMGTADYMSPEQVLGAELDGRSDIFSCGALLFELLTGRPPFHAESFVTIAYRVVHQEPDYGLIPAPSASLIPVLKKALAKPRDERFESALDFATEIGLATGVGVAPDTIQSSLGWNLPLPFPRPPKPGTTVRLRKSWEEGPTRPLDASALPAWPLRAPEDDHHEPESPLRPRRIRRRGRARMVSLAVAIVLGVLAILGWMWMRPAPAVTAAPVAAGGRKVANASPPPVAVADVDATPNPFQEPSWLNGGAPLLPAASPGPAASGPPPVPSSAEERRVNDGRPFWIPVGSTAPVQQAPEAAVPPPTVAAEPAPPKVVAGRWTGFITDETCRSKGAVSDHGSCLAVCLRRGRRPMILVDGQLYWLQGIERVSGLHDRRVRVEGQLDVERRTITVSSGAPVH